MRGIHVVLASEDVHAPVAAEHCGTGLGMVRELTRHYLMKTALNSVCSGSRISAENGAQTARRRYNSIFLVNVASLYHRQLHHRSYTFALTTAADV